MRRIIFILLMFTGFATQAQISLTWLLTQTGQARYDSNRVRVSDTADMLTNYMHADFSNVAGSLSQGNVVGLTSALAQKAPLTSPTFLTSITGSYLTASEMLITDGSKNIVSAPVATYPSLTELTYLKGVTSAVQTQLNAKQNTLTTGYLYPTAALTSTTTNIKDQAATSSSLYLGTTSAMMRSDGLAAGVQDSTTAFTLANYTAAAAGAQQKSPTLQLVGHGWKTNATAASQTVRMLADLLPVQGTSAPTSTFRMSFNANNGAFTDALTLTSGGAFTINTSITTGTYITSFSSGAYTNTGSNTLTSGTLDRYSMSGSFAPTSGTAVHNGFTYSGTINQTGGANGITRGVYVNPTITAAADFRAIETTNSTGKSIVTGTAPSTFGGTVTFPTPFTLGATSVTTTGTQLNYLNAATGTTGTTSSNVVFSASPTFTGTITAATITGSNAISTNGGGMGYHAGAGGTVTQLTSRTTGVTLDKLSGVITMFSAAQAANAVVTFTFTNSFIGSDDYLVIQHNSTGAAGAQWAISVSPNAGNATISVRNVTTASITEATQLRFFVFKTADN